MVGVQRPLADGRVAADDNVNPDNSLENVIMKSPDMTQRSSVAAKTTLKDLKPRSKQKGLTMVEYAIAGFLVTVACVAAFTALGEQIAVVINGIVADLGG